MHLADENAPRGAGGVGEHVAEEQVEVGGPQFQELGVGALRRVNHSEVHHFDAVASDLLLEHTEVAHQLVEQPVELAPIRIVANAEDADVGGQRLPSRDLHIRGLREFALDDTDGRFYHIVLICQAQRDSRKTT